jgi:hypothetical protein
MVIGNRVTKDGDRDAAVDTKIGLESAADPASIVNRALPDA